MTKRARPGDVLEIEAPEGWVYVHYLGKHPSYGDAIAVSPVNHAERMPASAELFRAAYVTFYPATTSVARGFARIAGHVPSPGLPKRFRRPGARSNARVETWIIEEGSAEVVKRTLTDDDLELPIAAIWNHEFLLQRVAEGWRPEQEGRVE